MSEVWKQSENREIPPAEQNCVRERMDTTLYLVTDSSYHTEESFLRTVEEALRGRVKLLQLREKEKSAREYMELADKVRQICDRYQVPLLIDDRVDVAAAVGAAGVHVGQSDMEAGDVRRKLGPDKIIGVSAQTVEQALRAQEHGADYLGVGAVFPTGSKADAVEVSRETLKEICRAVDIPVIAIGGISRDNVMELKGSGICGIAVISAIFAQKDVEAAAGELKKQVEEMLA